MGSTGDLKRRFQEHAGGKVESTRHRRPLALIAYEAYLTKPEAERREKFLKTSDGKKDLRKRLKESLQPQTHEDPACAGQGLKARKDV